MAEHLNEARSSTLIFGLRRPLYLIELPWRFLALEFADLVRRVQASQVHHTLFIPGALNYLQLIRLALAILSNRPWCLHHIYCTARHNLTVVQCYERSSLFEHSGVDALGSAACQLLDHPDARLCVHALLFVDYRLFSGCAVCLCVREYLN